MDNDKKYKLKRFVMVYLLPPITVASFETKRLYDMVQAENSDISIGEMTLVFLGVFFAFMLFMRIIVAVYRFIHR